MLIFLRTPLISRAATGLAVLIISALAALPGAHAAGPALPDSRSVLPQSWSSNLRFSIDVSSRPLYSTASDEWNHIDFVGADLHKVFTGERGDIGTLTMQGYFTRIEEEALRPGFFDGKWEFVYRIFNFNYGLLQRGRLNLKVGHFEIPFGLEHSINTNGTLLDYSHGTNIGVKADWGVSLNGRLPAADYEISLTRGSGNNWETAGEPYIVAGRIGTLPYRNLILGISAMSGDVYVHGSNDLVVERHRIGADLQWYFRRYGVLAEVAIGKDDNRPVMNSLVEFNWRSARLTSYLQWIYRWKEQAGQRRDTATAVNVGAKWDLNSRWDLSAQIAHDINSFNAQKKKSVYVLQARYRF